MLNKMIFKSTVYPEIWNPNYFAHSCHEVWVKSLIRFGPILVKKCPVTFLDSNSLVNIFYHIVVLNL